MAVFLSGNLLTHSGRKKYLSWIDSLLTFHTCFVPDTSACSLLGLNWIIPIRGCIEIILIWLQFHKNLKTGFCFLVLFIVCIVLFGRQLLTGCDEIKRLSLKSFQDVQNIVPSLVIGTSKDQTPMMITNIFYSQLLDLKSLFLRVVFTNFSSYLFPYSTETFLVRLSSWQRPPRHLPLQKRQQTMPGCAVFW